MNCKHDRFVGMAGCYGFDRGDLECGGCGVDPMQIITDHREAIAAMLAKLPRCSVRDCDGIRTHGNVCVYNDGIGEAYGAGCCDEHGGHGPSDDDLPWAAEVRALQAMIGGGS